MRVQRQKLISIFLGVFFVFLILINRHIRLTALNLSAKSDADKLESSINQGKTPEVFDEESSQYHLKPDDPAKYNIKFQRQYDNPLTEQGWEYRMQQSFSATAGGQAAGPVLGSIKKTPREIESQMAAISAQIKEYEAVASRNPGDRQAQEKLQTLYMLKATLMVLKDKAASTK